MSGREGEPAASFPNLWQGAGIAAVYLAVASWLATAVLLVAPSLGWPAWTALLSAHFVGFPLALAFGLWVGKLDLWDILAFKRVRPAIWLPLFLIHLGGFLLIQGFAHGVEVGLEWALPAPMREAMAHESLPMISAGGSTVGLVFASAALPEEVLFRGLILRGYLRRYRPWIAIGLSTALFMASHGNPLQFPVALFLGATAGWYYQATGSLWPGLAAHALHNLFIGLTLDGAAVLRGSLISTPRPATGWLWAAPVLVLVGLLGMRWVFRHPESRRPSILDSDPSAEPLS